MNICPPIINIPAPLTIRANIYHLPSANISSGRKKSSVLFVSITLVCSLVAGWLLAASLLDVVAWLQEFNVVNWLLVVWLSKVAWLPEVNIAGLLGVAW